MVYKGIHYFSYFCSKTLTSTHYLCFEQKYEKYESFYLKIFSFLEVKFSIYLNRRIFVMKNKNISALQLMAENLALRYSPQSGVEVYKL